MKKEDKEPRISPKDSTLEPYFRKQEEREVNVHRDYLGWKIYCHKKRFKPSFQYELIRKFKQRFQAWDAEESDGELVLYDPEHHEFSITIRFGNFVTQMQNEFSVEIESQSFDWKRRQMRDHWRVGCRILGMLQRGKKEAYRITKQGLVWVPVRKWKYSGDALLAENHLRG